MASPRLVTIADAARYCGLSEQGYRDWIRRGIVPGPLEGTNRYDIRAIDRALDAHSGLDTEVPPAEASAYDDWKRGRDNAA